VVATLPAKRIGRRLRKDDILIWPDNDIPGRRYAENVMAYVPHAILAEVPLNFPRGWDLADPVPDGADLRAILTSSDNVVALTTKATKCKNGGVKEMLRASLKIVPGMCVEEAATQALKDINEPKKTADVLIELADSADLFHTAKRDCYADVMVHGHRETMLVGGSSFKRWLYRRYYDVEKSAPNSEAVRSAIETIKAKATFDHTEREVHLRVAGHGDKIYLDLCDNNWRVVEIDAGGWRLLNASAPVRVRRTSGMLPLPIPVKDGSIEPLRSFINVGIENDFRLVVAWLLAALRPCVRIEKGLLA
jgi:hypothetical protein